MFVLYITVAVCCPCGVINDDDNGQVAQNNFAILPGIRGLYAESTLLAAIPIYSMAVKFNPKSYF